MVNKEAVTVLQNNLVKRLELFTKAIDDLAVQAKLCPMPMRHKISAVPSEQAYTRNAPNNCISSGRLAAPIRKAVRSLNLDLRIMEIPVGRTGQLNEH